MMVGTDGSCAGRDLMVLLRYSSAQERPTGTLPLRCSAPPDRRVHTLRGLLRQGRDRLRVRAAPTSAGATDRQRFAALATAMRRRAM